MKREFVPYELALKLKELGFDEPCLFLYNSTDDDPKPFLASPPEAMDWNTLYIEKTNKHLMSAPTFSQCFRWFREKYDIIHNIDRIFKDEFGYIITPGDKQPINAFNFNSHEEAEIACLEYLIELVESKSE